jgi:hypothetical protein
MQRLARKRTGFLLLAGTLLARGGMAAPEGMLQLPSFEALARKATQTVNVTLDSNLLGVAAGFLDSSQPEDAAVRDVIAGLKGIYVRSYTFDKDFPYPRAEVDSIRKQLSAPGWQQLVSVHGGQPPADVDIYLSVDHAKANGLAIIATQPRQFTVVNIVGSIDLQKLHHLEGKFGVPKLPPGGAPPASQ